MITNVKLIPATEVMARRGGGRGGRHGGHSKLYAEIAEGLWPPFIKFGRSSLQPECEVNSMLSAIVAGATDDERRQLVQQLVAQRKMRSAS
jgi:hypothetical protein